MDSSVVHGHPNPAGCSSNSRTPPHAPNRECPRVGFPLFTGRTDAPTALAIELTEVVAKVFGLVENPVAINGHIAALPEVLIEDPSWDLSASRAMRTRQLLEDAGMDPGRTLRVTGYADRKLGYRNPMAARNNRIELILIRSDL